MFCPNCGVELPIASARFCSNCGTLLSTNPAQTPKSSPTRATGVQAPSAASASSESPMHAAGYHHPVLREQIAQQPNHPASGAERELHVKIWKANQDEPVEAASSPYEEHDEREKHEEHGGHEEQSEDGKSREPAVDDWPTVPLMTDVLAPVKAPEAAPPLTPSPDVQDMAKAHELTVEQLDTTPLTSYSQKELVEPAMPAPSIAPAAVRAQKAFPLRTGAMLVSSRRPLFVVLALVLVLIVIGTIAWALVLQPFSVPTVTNPQQHFSDTRLGLSLSYPTGWHVQIDTKAAALHFADSTNTAQVNITVANAAGTNQALYAQKLISQLGMTNVKPSQPLTFAGASWLQFQGSVLEKGASYTETLLVTVHGAHLYTLAQLAPQGIYTQEEHLVFAPMRSSLRFLS